MAETNQRTLVQRADKKVFWGLKGDSTTTFTRMRGFTEISQSKNPKEYSRQYVDEYFEETDVTGYSPSISFAFDEYTNDPVIADIADIIDEEKTGEDAVREIVFVDFSKPAASGGFEAYKRSFAVVADSEGDSTDAYTYSGNLKVKTSRIKGTATIATPTNGDKDSVETVNFTAESTTTSTTSSTSSK